MAGYLCRRSSLSRNIHELRKALGDDTAEPCYIETIPKRGYRFVAPLKVSVLDDGVGAEATIIEKHTFARVLSEEFEGPDLPAEIEPLPSQRLLTPARDTARRTRIIVLVASAVLALLLVGGIKTFLNLKRHGVSSAQVSRAKSTLVRLTNNSARDAESAWSPDGSRIAFSSNRDGKTEIYVMAADGSNVTRLTNNLSDDYGPKWSPDGRKILFDSEHDGNKEITATVITRFT